MKSSGRKDFFNAFISQMCIGRRFFTGNVNGTTRHTKLQQACAGRIPFIFRLADITTLPDISLEDHPAIMLPLKGEGMIHLFHKNLQGFFAAASRANTAPEM